MSKADIEINGKRYSVVCAPGQEARLAVLGTKLDRRVRHIADAVGDIGESRLLLVAALALLDEVDGLKSQSAKETENDQKAVSALADAAARINAIASRLDAVSTNTH